MHNQQFFTVHPVDDSAKAKIKVLGVGGGGSNAVDHMVSSKIEGVEFFVANTDAQALMRTKVINRIQFGNELTRGLGTGSNPSRGRDAAMEDKNCLIDPLRDADMIFITAGMGGGTGTGASPIIAKYIKEENPDVLVVGVVTTPFEFEGPKRMQGAITGLEELKAEVDSLITIPNEKILEECEDLLMQEAYAKANDVLLNAVRGISDVVIKPGMINVDFADVKTVMAEAGLAMMGIGSASGENRMEKAVNGAINNPLLSDVDVSNASALLVNVTSSDDMSTKEFIELTAIVKEFASEDAIIIPGQVFEDDSGEEIRVTIIATGLGEHGYSEPEPEPEPDNVYVLNQDDRQTFHSNGIDREDQIPAIVRRRRDKIAS